MANHKRKKSKRNVKCTICTTYRWGGNSKIRMKAKEAESKKRSAREIRESKP